MAEEKPSPVTFHEYDIPTMNTWFAWSAALLFVVSVWMIWADYHREWKDYQRRFDDLERARTRAQIGEARKSVDQKELEGVQAKLAEGQKTREARKADLRRLRSRRDGLLGVWYAADQAYRFAKAELDVARYELEEAKEHGRGVPAAQKRFDDVVAEVERRRLAFEEADGERKGVEGEIAAIDATAEAARKEMERLLKEETRLKKQLAGITDRGLMGLTNWFRNQPLVDFLAPSIKVRQVVLPQVHADVNFLTVPRVDRCHTCHLAIDKPGYTGEKTAPVFRTHPRLETLIGRNHPVERFGCTPCHAGSGLAITFVDAAHTPRSAEQEHAWHAKYEWHKLHHWDFPMLPLPFTEANCVNCHDQETRIAGADRLNAGRDLVEKLGCWGCHKIDRPGWDELRKVGPELAHIRDKVSPEWMVRWVKDPKSFRPSTRMPRFWGNSNTRQATAAMNYPLRDDVEAGAVVRYLVKRSKPYPALARPPAGLKGDATRGRWVVENRGCKGCHVVGEGDTGEGRFGADFGPELNQVGSKLTLGWLYAWILDPEAVWPETKMPDLRLSEQEALDAAAYLMTLRNPEFEGLEPPDLATPEARAMLEAVTYEYLRKETTTEEAKESLAGMDEEARYDYLGNRLIVRYGCFGCHDGVPGFEQAQRIGTELTTWASKLLTQLDFGLVEEIPHTKHDFLRNKLKDPRIYDRGKVATKDPQDLLRMPNFQLSDEEIDKVMTAVLGFQRSYVQPEGARRLDFAQSTVEKGRRLLRRSNCQGCHLIEDAGGGMETVLQGGKPFAPPVLVASFKTLDGRQGRTEEGAKVQPDWLFEFLKGPTPIRPWLNVRMPTFGLTDEQATTLVSYFAVRAEEPFPFRHFDRADIPRERVSEGEKLFRQFQCESCHLPLEQARKLGISVDQLAPNLELAKERLRYDWLVPWLKDPGALQKDTRMPAFFYQWDEDQGGYLESMPEAERKMEAVRDYLQFHGEARPPTVARLQR